MLICPYQLYAQLPLQICLNIYIYVYIYISMPSFVLGTYVFPASSMAMHVVAGDESSA